MWLGQCTVIKRAVLCHCTTLFHNNWEKAINRYWRFMFTFLIIFGKAEDDWEELMMVRNAATEQMSREEVDKVRIFFGHRALNQPSSFLILVFPFFHFLLRLSAALSLSKLSRWRLNNFFRFSRWPSTKKRLGWRICFQSTESPSQSSSCHCDHPGKDKKIIVS